MYAPPMTQPKNTVRARRALLGTALFLSVSGALACGVGASTIVTQYPPSETALDQIDAAAAKASCTTERTTLIGAPAVRATCKEGSVTFFREKGTLRVDMGDKVLAECGDTPRPACDTITGRIIDTAQGKTPAPASAAATAPAPTATAPTASASASVAPTAAPAPSASAAPVAASAAPVAAAADGGTPPASSAKP